jgi:hypothetical protein
LGKRVGSVMPSFIGDAAGACVCAGVASAPETPGAGAASPQPLKTIINAAKMSFFINYTPTIFL